MQAQAQIKLGTLTVTTTLYNHCHSNNINIRAFVEAFQNRQWGDLCQSDIDSNDAEVDATAGHLLGKYNLPTGEDIYIETNWNDEGFRHTSVHFVDEH